MIYLYTEHITNRLQYTLDVLMNRVLMCEYRIITTAEEFRRIRNVPKINYSTVEFGDSLSIRPHGLLFDTGIKPVETAVSKHDGIPYFFRTSTGGEMPYDLLAMTFYMISRYEEYLPFEADKHGRFPAQQSLAHIAGFLHLPVVHLWAERLKELIKTRHPGYEFPRQVFRRLDSIDIDYAYRFRGKGLIRNTAGFARDAARLDGEALTARLDYLRSGKDPYDTYEYIFRVQNAQSRERIFFIQTGKYGKYDKNLPYRKRFKELIRRIAAHGETGIHPSYASAERVEVISAEKERIEKLTGRKITKSRQHYLRLQFPGTYETLVRAGIEQDYSMGFAATGGFRAGIAIPYPFFHLSKDEVMPLEIVPFQVMDVSMKDYRGYSPEEALDEISEYKRILQKTGGILVSIFHNSSLSGEGEWKGWRKVYETW